MTCGVRFISLRAQRRSGCLAHDARAIFSSSSSRTSWLISPSAIAPSTALGPASPSAASMPPAGARSMREVPRRRSVRLKGPRLLTPLLATPNGSPSTCSGTPLPSTSIDTSRPCASRTAFEKPARVCARWKTPVTQTISRTPSSAAGGTASVCIRSRDGSGAPCVGSHRSEPPPYEGVLQTMRPWQRRGSGMRCPSQVSVSRLGRSRCERSSSSGVPSTMYHSLASSRSEKRAGAAALSRAQLRLARASTPMER
mmetsp:Transcript_4306/g.13840  ORF Transcript_4306/g.13840 Transcript_4306/m.13840 type:complete len:255 (-) Transcript_4306:1087-1851(-)